MVFSPIMWGSTLPTRFRPVFGWQVGADTVTPTQTEGQWGENRLPGAGEVVWYDANPALPQAASSGQPSVYNVVMWAAPNLEPRIVYTAPLALSNTMFIDGGERIAFRVSAFDRAERWLALDRSGHTSELPAAPLIGTPDGYLTLDTPDGAAGTRLYRVITRRAVAALAGRQRRLAGRGQHAAAHTCRLTAAVPCHYPRRLSQTERSHARRSIGLSHCKIFDWHP